MKVIVTMISPGSISTPRRKNAAVQAFTLIEVLVAALIGAIIFTALYSGIANSFAILNTSRANLRATQVMLSRMEGLRLCAWGNGTNQASQLFNSTIIPNTFTDYFCPNGLNGQTDNFGTVYIGNITITTNLPLNTSYGTNMAMVTVTVNWVDGFSGHTNSHSRTMSTYVSQYGMQNYVYAH